MLSIPTQIRYKQRKDDHDLKRSLVISEWCVRDIILAANPIL